jgi:hypothetical protein
LARGKLDHQDSIKLNDARFNSFTQEIRMDSAVLYDDPTGREKTSSDSKENLPSSSPANPKVDGTENEVKASKLAIPSKRNEQRGANVSQIVSYSARFVHKLSEVTSAMGISGPMSIKAGVVGGSTNGSYIDSDKFRHADINYFVQVKVTNQIQGPPDSLVFNPLLHYDSYTSQSFTDIYGDSFISGFVEGGEFDAIISIKAHKGTNIDYLKWYVEKQFSSFNGTNAGEGEEPEHKYNLHDLGETTVVVNWCGGGFIKEQDTLWTLETIPRIAANFAAHAAATPQRI